MVRYKILTKKKYDSMKKMGYIDKGLDGLMRGIFFEKGRGTVSIPVKRRR